MKLTVKLQNHYVSFILLVTTRVHGKIAWVYEPPLWKLFTMTVALIYCSFFKNFSSRSLCHDIFYLKMMLYPNARNCEQIFLQQNILFPPKTKETGNIRLRKSSPLSEISIEDCIIINVQ